jgi:RNA polymerase sigma factor (sigma-70 family)
MEMTMAAAMTDDAELLRRYAGDRAEDAFAELVRRYLDLVHSAALRQVGGNPASAADVAQAVFTELARHAGRLTRHPALTGWLYTTTHRMAARHVRGEVRRQRREQEAHVMQELQRDTGPEPDWARLRPVLDAAMHDIGETDRTAVLLRHFEQRPLAEVGSKLGLSENAARMRVERALDKLRTKLAKRGVTSTASALAVALTGQAVTAAPTTLADAITTAAFAATVTTSTFGLLSIMTSTQFKTAGAALLIAAAGTTIALQQLSARRLRAENVELRQRADTAAEDARLARQANTESAEAGARSSQSQPELLRLRGEVGQLRQQLAAARRTSPKTADQPASAPSAASEEKAKEATKQFGLRRLSEAKLLVMGFMLHASSHDGQFPDSLETSASVLRSEKGVGRPGQDFGDPAN